jgi:transcription elongation factor GreA
MGKEKKYIFTKEGFDNLMKDLEYRKNELRDKLRDTVADMRQKGDLSENDGYTTALEENQANETEIAEMEEKVKNAKIVKGTKNGKINIGETVVLEDADKNIQKYQIVGEDEANPMEGKISFKSPLGEAILGKKKGQKVETESPAGKKVWTIKEVN